MEPSAILGWGLDRLGIEVADDKRRQLLAFVELLARWNRIFNLTAVKDPRQMVIRHLLDSLAVLPYIEGAQLLDVGSGAGLPGIPLAIVAPQWRVTLLDKQLKKTRFMLQAVTDLGLDHVDVIHLPAERYRPAGLFDTVISRAFSSLGRLVEACGRLCAPTGRLLAMKAGAAATELDALPPGYQCLDNVPLHVPGLNAARRLLIITPPQP